jgi:hypothetical protein
LDPTGQLRVSFRGKRDATGPLAFGQRDTYAWVTAGEDSYAAMLFWRLRLPDGVRMGDITAALRVLMERHESLRTNYLHGPVQLVAAYGEVLVDLFRVPEQLRGEPLSAIEDMLVAEMRAEDMDFTIDVPIRAAIAMVDGVPYAGALLCSHMAVDLGSMAVLGTEFAELAATSMAGEPLPVDEPARHQPLDQAEFERTPTSLRRKANAIRYWAEHLRRSPGAQYSMPAPDEPVSAHLSGFLHTTAGGGALGRIADRVGTGRQIVLLAAVCTVLAMRTGVHRCVFAVLSSNRFRQRLHGYVGALAQDSLLSFDVDGDDFDEVVRRVGAATLAANTNSLYDIVELTEVMDQVGNDRGIAFNRDFSFNNLSDFMSQETGEPDVADDTPTSITWLEWEHFPEMLMCHPVSLGRQLVVALTANLRYVAKSDLELLLYGVERLLVEAADGVVPLDKLPELTGVEPIVRDADWVCVDSCWVRLTSVRRLVIDALDVSAAQVVLADRGLVAYLPATVDSVAAAHSACMAALPERYNTMAPGHYVLTDGMPGDPADTSAWRALPVVAEGSGRSGS